ncbi:MAG: ferrochelatase [Candidatus Electrothrix aestuarii]|uniref:Ferrochelatase n=1 Tax=Candidatus Electrothrix aestuarii TaxID=3062594 RepID=A0AAU8LZK3_9BACT|nr:ferrochelatase [Candidatus Electrothrix aestuarii]
MDKKIGVLLLNMGGPEKQEDVRSFLYNLFSDRQIIRLGPALLQKPIAAMIARKRAPGSMANYQKLGGGSPLTRITAEQAQALEQSLADDGDFIVRSCMRYWHPFADAALQEMVNAGVRQLIALPLYPHYCRATTESSFSDLRRHKEKLSLEVPLREISSWPDEPEYIDALASRVRDGLALFSSEEQDAVQLVYSAHSLPKKFIDQGDPYVEELQRTIAALEEQVGRQGRLCFQSRSGPVEWLEPSTPDMLKQLAEEGQKNILMIPIAFVSDHIETLYEIDMLYKEQAAGLGMRLESTRGLNDDPQFIQALRTLVLRARDTE